MDFLILQETFLDLTEKIDQYFDDKLDNEPRARANLEYIKEDLKQNLQEEIWANWNRTTYENYDPKAFVWLKVEKVWLTYCRILKKETARRDHREVEFLPELASGDNIAALLECRELVVLIKNDLKPRDFQLLEYRANKMSYKEIAKTGLFPTKEAAKTQMNRLKKYLRENYSRY